MTQDSGLKRTSSVLRNIRHGSFGTKLIAGLVAFTVSVTGIIQEMAGLHVLDAFANPPLGSPYGTFSNIDESQVPVQSFQTDLFSGRGQFTVPVFAPSGRRGLTPQLSLNYSSTAKNGWMGIGWDLEVGYIQRTTSGGVPTYDDEVDRFTFLVQGAGADLVKISANEYHAEHDSGDFMKVNYQAGSWTALDKSGREYTFGESSQAKQTNSHGTYKWLLEKVKDANGNIIEYTYSQDGGNVYLSRIDYNGNENEVFPNTHSVEFVLEDRPDDLISYSSGARVETNKRLKEILVKVDNVLSRKYSLTYEQSPVIGKSRLIQVEECGMDELTCFPPTAFTYQDHGFALETDHTIIPISNPVGEDRYKNVRTGGSMNEEAGLYDINGDGLPDRIIGDYYFEDNNWKVYYNTGDGFETDPVLWPITIPNGGYYWFRRTQLWSAEGLYLTLLDLNGDGYSDRLYTNPAVEFNDIHVFYNQNGTSFSMTDDPLLNVPKTGTYAYIRENLENGNSNVQVEFIDIDGDGLLERVVKDGNNNQWKIYDYVDGELSSSPRIWSIPNPEGEDRYKNIRTGGQYDEEAGLYDLNGDGLPDRIIADYDYNNEWKVYYNNGNGFESTPDLWPIVIPQGGYYAFRKIQQWAAEGLSLTLLDFNGDGLLDRMYTNPAVEFNDIHVFYNTGNGFVMQDTPLVNVPKSGSYAYIREHLDYTNSNVQGEFIDLDGDGLLERVTKHQTNNEWKFYNNQGEFPDLLKTIDNGRGSITTVEYSPSTQFDNTDLSGFERLPFPVQVVTKISQTDGIGNEYVTEYSYKGGMFDAGTKEFRGFRETTVIDGENTQTIHTFHQNAHLKGRPISIEVKDGLGNLFSREETAWTCNDQILPGVHFIYAEERSNFLYDGDGTYKQVRERYEYDDWGNQTVIYQDGDVSVATDDRKTVSQYVQNETNYVMNTLAITQVFDYQDTEESKQYFYYDGHEEVMQDPEEGILTKSEEFLQGQQAGEGAKTTVTYDGFGNVDIVKDAMNQITDHEYDNNYELFVSTITNPLGHVKQFTYDPLIGQITESIDANGQATKTVYDALGRVVKVVSPEDTLAAPTQAIYYDDFTIPNRIVTHVKADSDAPAITIDDQPHTGYLTTYTFFDGFSRQIEERKPAENANQQIVSDFITFDSRGQPAKHYVPYLADFGTTYATPPVEFPHAVFTYDAVGRRTRVDYPDGTFSQTIFDDFKRTEIDQNGHQKTETQDGFGNLIKVEEFNEGQTYTTLYEYDAMSRLVKTTDHLGNETVVTYDLLGRKLSTDDPNMGYWEYTYDDNGNLKTQKDAKNQTITFHYDELNRVTRKAYPDQSEVVYVYDDCPPVTCGGLEGGNYPIGRLLKVDEASNVKLFRYDKLGRVIQDQVSLSDGKDYSFTRIYDPLGRVTALEYPDEEILTLGFNLMGEVETMTLINKDQSQSPVLTNIDYNPSGQVTKIEYGNGVVTDYTYNPQTLRLDNLITQNQAQTTLQNLTYGFDDVGNVLSITDAINTNSQTFLYDDLDRLKQATGSYGTRDYVYNPIGNITTKGPATLEYNDPNHPHAVTRYTDGTETLDYVYDANGNTIQRGAETLTYDYDNRLVEIREGSTVIGSYVYDVTGQRIEKDAGNQTTYYVGQDYEVEYTGQGSLTRKAFFLGNIRIAEEEETIAPCVVAEDYLEFAEAEEGLETPVAEESQYTQTSYSTSHELRVSKCARHFRFFHQDHLGSTNVVTNSQGQQILLMEYYPYGEVKRREGSDPVSHTFTGHEEDLESDLIYAGARFYDPKIGRFISADIFVQDPSDPQSLNRYAYARNNPIRFTDPTGHFWWFIIAIIAAVVKAAVAVVSAVLAAVQAVAQIALQTLQALSTAIVGEGAPGSITISESVLAGGDVMLETTTALAGVSAAPPSTGAIAGGIAITGTAATVTATQVSSTASAGASYTNDIHFSDAVDRFADRQVASHRFFDQVRLPGEGGSSMGGPPTGGIQPVVAGGAIAMTVAPANVITQPDILLKEARGSRSNPKQNIKKKGPKNRPGKNEKIKGRSQRSNPQLKPVEEHAPKIETKKPFSKWTKLERFIDAVARIPGNIRGYAKIFQG